MSTGGSSCNIPSLPPHHYHQYPGSDQGTTPLVIIKDRHQVTIPWNITLQGLYDAPTLEEHIDQLLLLDTYRTTNTLLGYEGVDVVIPACYLVFLWYLAFCLHFCYLHSLSEAIHALGLANEQQVKVLSAFFAQAVSSVCHVLSKGVLTFYVIVVYIPQGIAYVYCEGVAKLLQALLPQAEEEGWLLYEPPSSCRSALCSLATTFAGYLVLSTTWMWLVIAHESMLASCQYSFFLSPRYLGGPFAWMWLVPIHKPVLASCQVLISQGNAKKETSKQLGAVQNGLCFKSTRDDLPTPPDIIIVHEKYHLCPHFRPEFGKRERAVGV
ncbi:hypothetical protein EDD85DRAFT_797317 [Armillaria nabsnona]|nr:hypothetical protein EDD85DRAFT_797317 [Armillaria nabsnona]